MMGWDAYVPPSCRDKGRMWGWVGALCLSSLGDDQRGSRNPDETCCHEDKHKAPTLPRILPLSLQEAGDAGVPVITAFGCQSSSGREQTHYRIRLSKIIRTRPRALLHVVGKIARRDTHKGATGYGGCRSGRAGRWGALRLVRELLVVGQKLAGLA